MESQEIDEALDRSLGMMREGASIDECVARYPERATELRAQLSTVQALRKARPRFAPQTAAREQGRARLLAAVAERREAAAAGGGVGLLAAVQSFLTGGFWRAPALVARAAPAALAVLILGGAAWGVSAATGNPNPGNWFVTDSTSEQRIELRGTITVINSDLLTIDTGTGLELISVTDQTEFEGEGAVPMSLAAFGVGDLVRVSAVLDEDGTLVAKEMELEHAAADGDAQGDDDQGDVDDIDDADVGDAEDDQGDDDQGDVDDSDDGDDENTGDAQSDDDDGLEDGEDSSSPDIDDAGHEDSEDSPDGGEADEEDEIDGEDRREAEDSRPSTDEDDGDDDEEEEND